MHPVLQKISSNKPLATAIIIVVVVLIIYFVGKSKGKEKAEKLVKKYARDYPTSGSGIPEAWDASEYANRVYSTHKGPNVWNLHKKRDLYQTLLSFTDDQLTAVYNVFNSMYLKDGDGTLTDWIADETLPTDGGSLELIRRLEEIGLPKADDQDVSPWYWPF